MNTEWNKLCESLATYGELISQTLEQLPKNKQSGRIKKHMTKEWDRLTESVSALDQLIDPINPPEIELPFESERFKAMWQYYKDYLANNHNFALTPWNENSRMQILNRFSKGDEERAMMILELMCSNNYRNLICPSEKQLTGEEAFLPEQSASMGMTIGSIPAEI